MPPRPSDQVWAGDRDHQRPPALPLSWALLEGREPPSPLLHNPTAICDVSHACPASSLLCVLLHQGHLSVSVWGAARRAASPPGQGVEAFVTKRTAQIENVRLDIVAYGTVYVGFI